MPRRNHKKTTQRSSSSSGERSAGKARTGASQKNKKR